MDSAPLARVLQRTGMLLSMSPLRTQRNSTWHLQSGPGSVAMSGAEAWGCCGRNQWPGSRLPGCRLCRCLRLDCSSTAVPARLSAYCDRGCRGSRCCSLSASPGEGTLTLPPRHGAFQTRDAGRGRGRGRCGSHELRPTLPADGGSIYCSRAQSAADLQISDGSSRRELNESQSMQSPLLYQVKVE